MSSIYQNRSSREVMDWARNHSRQRPMSHKQLSDKLGYRSDRTVGMVLRGDRIMSSALQRKLCDLLSLGAKERQYLDLLIEKDQLESQNKETYRIRQKLDSLRPPNYKLRVLTNPELALFQKWYSFTLIELIKTLEPRAKFKNIFAALKGNVGKGEIEETLNGLCQLNIISFDKGGFFVRDPNEYFLTTTDIPSTSIRMIHKQQMHRALRAIDEQSIKERCYFGVNIKISRKQYKEIEKKIESFITELVQISDDNVKAGEAVIYQINTQAYKQAEPL